MSDAPLQMLAQGLACAAAGVPTHVRVFSDLGTRHLDIDRATVTRRQHAGSGGAGLARRAVAFRASTTPAEARWATQFQSLGGPGSQEANALEEEPEALLRDWRAWSGLARCTHVLIHNSLFSLTAAAAGNASEVRVATAMPVRRPDQPALANQSRVDWGCEERGAAVAERGAAPPPYHPVRVRGRYRRTTIKHKRLTGGWGGLHCGFP